MKSVVFALIVTQTPALLLSNNTAKLHLKVKAKVNATARDTPIVDPIEKRREERAADTAHQEALETTSGNAELDPMDGTCSHNTMRCIYVHELPWDYCLITGQPPWCKEYVGEAACLMVENYDTYIEHKADMMNMQKKCEETICEIRYSDTDWADTGFDAKHFGRWLLGGKGTVSQNGCHESMICTGTRGWGLPRYMDPENPGELPSCKSNQVVGVCENHQGSRTDVKCPVCGATTGQDSGATHDNDVTNGGGLR